MKHFELFLDFTVDILVDTFLRLGLIGLLAFGTGFAFSPFFKSTITTNDILIGILSIILLLILSYVYLVGMKKIITSFDNKFMNKWSNYDFNKGEDNE